MKENNKIIEEEILDNTPINNYNDLKTASENNIGILDIFGDEVKKFNKFMFLLSSIKDKLEDQSNYGYTNLKLDLQKEEREKDKALYVELQNYYDAFKAIKETSSLLYDESQINDFIEKAKSFEEFLKAGEGKNNYTRMIETVSKKDPLAESKFEAGYKAFEDTFHFGFDFKKVKNAVAKQVENKNEPTQDAAFWIESLRIPVAQKHPNMDNLENLKKLISQIMAARLLSDSIRHDGSTLNKQMTKSAINTKAEELRSNDLYSAFLGKITEDPNLLVKAKKAICHGHGGRLDDMFTKYLAELEPGALKATKVISRFRPTALTRIEALQNYADSQPSGQSLALAEIVILRNAIFAERDHKSSLKVPIPEKYGDYNPNILSLSADENFLKIINDRSVLGKIKTGHGGEMIDNMRIRCSNLGLDNYNVGTTLYEGTIEARMTELTKKALDLIKKIDNFSEPDSNFINTNKPTIVQEQNKLTDAAIDISAEFIALAIYRSRHKSDPKIAKANIPWGEINEIKNSCKNNFEFKGVMGFGGQFNRTKTQLNEMTTLTPGNFIIQINNNLNHQISTVDKAAKQESKEQLANENKKEIKIHN